MHASTEHRDQGNSQEGGHIAATATAATAAAAAAAAAANC